MTKNNLYYYPQSYPNYTREEAIQIITKFIIRKLEKLFKFATVILIIVAAVVLYKGEQALKFAEEQLQLHNERYPYMEKLAERISIEQMVWNYINSLELPKEETSQMQVENTEILSEQVLKVEEVSKVTNVKYEQRDVELLAQLMYAEEGVFFREYSEDPGIVEWVHKLAGSVVIHRAELNYLGHSTIEGTIFADGQYAGQTLERVTEGQDIPDIVYTWAEELLTEGALGPKGMIYQAEFKQGDDTYDEIGNQHFCIETKYN